VLRKVNMMNVTSRYTNLSKVNQNRF